MSGNILLELTPKEIQVLGAALISHKTALEKDDKSSKIVTEEKNGLCESIWGKVREASKTQPDVLINYKDFCYLTSLAKSEYHNLHADMHISKKPIEQGDLMKISIANALLLWLNSKGLLKKLVKFDYTDESTKYEETD